MPEPFPQIISASRRTDMPAFFLGRLVSWIAEGAAQVANPYSGAVSTVPLDPASVHTLVLWSKHFAPFLEFDTPFKNYRLYFLHTINDMPALEPSLPPLESRLETLHELAARYGPSRIGWRFDPIAFTADGPCTDINAFTQIADAVAAAGVTRLIISFLDFYGKVKTRNNTLGLGLIDPSPQQKRDYTEQLAAAAHERGFTVEACCEDLAGITGIIPAACIDGKLLGELAGEPVAATRDRGQRANCRCTASRDIGSYRDMPCPAGCRYCYANPLIPQPAGGVA